MKKIVVKIGGRAAEYPVFVNADASEAVKLAQSAGAGKIAVVCSRNTRIFAERIAGNAPVIEAPDGENAKTLETVQMLYSAFIAAKLDRASIAMIVSGGTLGDVAAFACSTYLRGIRFVHVPTTLLAMADSSIGGKTGVDFKGKNTVGTFAQPLGIVMDFSLLGPLPEAEVRSGAAEIVKCACIRDAKLFDFLEENTEKLLSLDEPALEHCISRAAEIKAEIVASDEREAIDGAGRNSRMLLNFGHTVGHAIEAATNYSIRHGGAVSIGMVAEARIAEEMGVCRKGVSHRISALLQAAKLPIALPKGIRPNELTELMRSDKKSVGGAIRMVGLESVGKTRMMQDVPVQVVLRVLEGMR